MGHWDFSLTFFFPKGPSAEAPEAHRSLRLIVQPFVIFSAQTH
jgi:hypothetical protein